LGSNKNRATGDGAAQKAIRSSHYVTNSQRHGAPQGLPLDYVLTVLRSGALRARLVASEADTIGIGLKHGLLSPEAALLWARDAGVFDFVGDFDIEAAASVEVMEAAP
jgi:hypothetical protein